MNGDKYLTTLERLSRLHGMSIVEIANLARKLAMAELDPLSIGEMDGEFVFQNDRPRREPFGDLPDDYDLEWINSEVPGPYARVDLFKALDEYRRDTERCASLLKRAPSLPLERLIAISDNQFAWAKFLAVRHPHEAMREMFANHVAKMEAEREKTLEQIDAKLRKRGVIPWH